MKNLMGRDNNPIFKIRSILKGASYVFK